MPGKLLSDDSPARPRFGAICASRLYHLVELRFLFGRQDCEHLGAHTLTRLHELLAQFALAGLFGWFPDDGKWQVRWEGLKPML